MATGLAVLELDQVEDLVLPVEHQLGEAEENLRSVGDGQFLPVVLGGARAASAAAAMSSAVAWGTRPSVSPVAGISTSICSLWRVREDAGGQAVETTGCDART